jgi:uncharacterized membrane protein
MRAGRAETSDQTQDKVAALNGILTRRRDLWLLAVAIVLLLAFALRVAGLGERTLWLDEAIEYRVAMFPLAEIHQAVARSTHDPPLYSYLLHLWLRGGMDEFWLRMPSLIFSLFSVAGVMAIGRFTAGPLVALTAGLLLAGSAADVRYAQEVGQYSLLVALVTAALLALYQAQRTNQWRWWLAWGGIAVIGLYSHYGAAIFTGATAVAFLLYHLVQRNWQAVWRQSVSGGLAVLLTAPLVLVVIPQQLGRLGSQPQPFNLSELLRISARILDFQFLTHYGLRIWPIDHFPLWPLTLLILIPIVVALAKTRSLTAPPALLAVTWLVYYLVGRTGAYFFDGTRHSLLLVPLIFLTLALGVVYLSRWRWWSGASLLTALMLLTLLFPRDTDQDLRTVRHFWLQNQQPGDATYVYYGARPGLEYQIDLARAQDRCPPSWGTACAPTNLYFGRWIRGSSLEEMTADVQQTIGDWPERLWLIFSHVHGQEDAQLVEALAPFYTVQVREIAEGGASAVLLIRQPAPEE